jgi:hypothetical protein
MTPAMSAKEKNPTGDEDEKCVGTCITCIPNCPRHPSNNRAGDHDSSAPASPLKTENKKPGRKRSS